MTNSDHTRSVDRWLKWAAIIGPFVGFVLGLCSGTVIAYQAYKNTSDKVDHLQSWQIEQQEFDMKTVEAIARLKALIKDTIP